MTLTKKWDRTVEEAGKLKQKSDDLVKNAEETDHKAFMADILAVLRSGRAVRFFTTLAGYGASIENQDGMQICEALAATLPGALSHAIELFNQE